MDVITEPNAGQKGDSSDILNIPVNQKGQQGGKLHRTTNDPKSVLLFGKFYSKLYLGNAFAVNFNAQSTKQKYFRLNFNFQVTIRSLIPQR